MDMFEFATRNKMRFPYKGMISVEDLWDLGVEALDSIFKALNAALKQTQEESLLSKRTKQDEFIAVQVDIIKHIVSVKQAEAAQRLVAKEQKEKKQRLLEILASKQDAALQGKTEEEIKAMIAEIDG
jgi:hypothetical protein